MFKTTLLTTCKTTLMLKFEFQHKNYFRDILFYSEFITELKHLEGVDSVSSNKMAL